MKVQPVRILLIEDNPGDARLFRERLRESPGNRFEITAVDHLAKGLEQLDRAPFQLVLLDLSLPDSTGLDTFRTLHSQQASIPIVVLTGLNDEQVGLQAVAEGAQDYLIKDQADTRRLVHAIHYALGRFHRVRKLEQQHHTTREELELVRQIYQRLLPKKMPSCKGFDIHGVSLPAGDAGGDYFDYVELASGQLKIVIGDVTGHGVGPALLMATTRAYLRAFAQNHADVGRMLTLANSALAEDAGPERNVTLLLGHLDAERRSFTYSSAGHQTGYVIAPGGAIKAELLSTGWPLGIIPDAPFEAMPPIVLDRGDIIFLYTDGIVDAFSAKGERFGRDRALSVIRAHRAGSARDMVEQMYRAVHEHAQEHPQRDDLTTIVIKAVE